MQQSTQKFAFSFCTFPNSMFSNKICRLRTSFIHRVIIMWNTITYLRISNFHLVVCNISLFNANAGKGYLLHIKCKKMSTCELSYSCKKCRAFSSSFVSKKLLILFRTESTSSILIKWQQYFNTKHISFIY